LVTEKGLEYLNVQNKQLTSSTVPAAITRNKQTSLVCPKLQVLRISGTPISDDRKVFKFLSKRTYLVQLSYDGMSNVMNIFCEKGLFGPPEDGKIQGIDLRSIEVDLSAFDLETSISSLLNTVTYCQKLVHIKLLHVSDHRQLLPIIQAGSVVQLAVDVEASDNEDLFHQGLLPVLEKIGSRLKSLEIIKMNNASFQQIGALCPNLEDFFFVTNICATVQDILPEMQNNIFQNIKSFRLIIMGRDSTDLNNSLKMGLRSILGNAKGIETLSLDGCDELQDDILSDVMNNNSFTNLRSLSLVSCNSITASFITQLLTQDNYLSFLQLHNCWNISRKDWEQFQQTAKMNNYDLEIEWI